MEASMKWTTATNATWWRRATPELKLRLLAMAICDDDERDDDDDDDSCDFYCSQVTSNYLVRWLSSKTRPPQQPPLPSKLICASSCGRYGSSLCRIPFNNEILKTKKGLNLNRSIKKTDILLVTHRTGIQFIGQGD